jgi:hypothetical protein
MLRTIQIIFGALGILLAVGSDKLSMPTLAYGGVACFGFLSMAIGWEAIITRQLVIGSRRRGTRETYTGIPAVLQGIQFNLIGLFLIGISVLVYFNNGREVFLQFVRRPGIPLVVIGVLLLLQSLVMFLGYREINEGPGFMVTINLILSRMLPGVILLVLGLGAMGLGLFEIVAPTVFDNLSGGFLEMLY